MIEEIKFYCSECDSKLSADSEHFGTEINCPVCHLHIQIPNPLPPPSVQKEIKPGMQAAYGEFVRLRPSSNPTVKEKSKIPSSLVLETNFSKTKKKKKNQSKLKRSRISKQEVHSSKKKFSYFPLIFVGFIGLVLYLGWCFYQKTQSSSPRNTNSHSIAKTKQKNPVSQEQDTSAIAEKKNETAYPPKYNYIFIEGENADKLIPSCEIDIDKNCSNGKYMIIREGVGSGWTKPPSGSGTAEYNFEVPTSGKYYLWARVKWESGCSNAFFIHIDDDKILPANRKGFTQEGAPKTLGKDTTLHQWHWYSRHVFLLEEGKHKLTIKNQDDGSSVDLFLFTDNPDFVPYGFGKNNSYFNTNNWEFKNKDWKLSEQNQKRKFIKQTRNPSILLTKNSTSLRQSYLGLYGAFKISGSNDFRLVFGYKNENNYLYVEKKDATYRILKVKNGQGQLLKSSMKKPSGKIKNVELFLNDQELKLLVNYQPVFTYSNIKKENLQLFKGEWGIDLNINAIIEDIKISSIEKPRLGCFHYAVFNQHPFTPIKGNWHVKGESFEPDGGALDTVMTTGAHFWKNYQISGMYKIPKDGWGGIGFYYHDLNNFYALKMNASSQKLIINKNGMEKILATSNTRMDPLKYKRVTVNIINGHIQVFYDRNKIFDIKDQTFYSGKCMLLTENILLGYAVDDLEIAKIEKPFSGQKNEPLTVLKQVGGARIINSVLDASGATGGAQPGDYSGERIENALKTATIELTGNKYLRDRARVLDFQWLTFSHNESFIQVSGNEGENGYISTKTIDKTQEHILWGYTNLYGNNWSVSFQAKGPADKLGFLLYDLSRDNNSEKNANSPKYYRFVCNRSKSNTIKDDYHKYEINFKNNIFTLFIDGKTISRQENKNKNAVWRPAIFYINANIHLDNLFAYVQPDYFYDFEYNQPCRLFLSDWQLKEGKSKYSGGYYSNLTLTNEKKNGSISTHREFHGNLIFVADIGIKNKGKFRFSLDPIDEGEKLLDIGIWESGIKIKDGAGKIIIKKIKGFSSEPRLYYKISINIVNSRLQIFLDDKYGNQRLVLSETIKTFGNKPYKIKLWGVPELKLHKIYIWGNEKTQ